MTYSTQGAEASMIYGARRALRARFLGISLSTIQNSNYFFSEIGITLWQIEQSGSRLQYSQE
jgi:hypothetical protein